ncbi:MAG: hypothetical protein RIS20_2015 [Bacteroidota bacterium]|jgi:uncharacterized protein (TIGR02453 family)
MSFFTEDYLHFFIELAGNNHKTWFDENRKRYETSVKKPFYAFTQHLIDQLAKKDPSFAELQSKDCVFRINRDIRFSKDKTPYKLMCSAVVAPNGKKSKAVNGIYFELSPEHVRAYGGIYEIDKEDLDAVREGIASNMDEFRSIYSSKTFKKTFGEILGEKNKVLPAHLKEAAQEENLIFNKQWYFYAEFPAEQVLSEDLDQLMLSCYEAGRPLEQFFNQFIQRS